MVLVVALSPYGGQLRGEESSELAGDLKALQGTWVTPPDSEPTSRWTFEGKTLRATVNDIGYVCKVTLDAKAQPGTIDLFISEGPDNSVGKTSLGIYKLEGERVSFCVTTPGQEKRPDRFEPVEGESHLFVLKKTP